MRMSDWSSDVCSSDLGAEWKALISRYIETIPLNGDVSCAAMQSMSEPTEAAVSSAMAAKVGGAARLSRAPAPNEAAEIGGASAHERACEEDALWVGDMSNQKKYTYYPMRA